MSRHYNVVISFNFSTEEDAAEAVRRFNGKGSKVLYRGIHEGAVYQRVITQKVIG